MTTSFLLSLQFIIYSYPPIQHYITHAAEKESLIKLTNNQRVLYLPSSLMA